jgi:glycosyltransferase involved in cell wall biosynthesis
LRAPKIALILGENIPSYWAHSFNVMKMAQGFANIGCQVEVITADSQKSRDFLKSIKNINTHYGLSRTIAIQYLSPSEKAYHNGQTRHDRIFCKSVLEYVKKEGFDVVYVRGNFVTPYQLVEAGIPAYLETHSKRSFLRRRTWKRKYDKIMRLANFKGLVTIHNDLKKENTRLGVPSKKVLVLEDGVDLQRFEISNEKSLWKKRLGLDINKQYAVYCGHLYPDKGIEVILKAARRLKYKENLRFLLVGGLSNDRERWEAYCKKYALTNVNFTGFVPNNNVPFYLKAADCLLLPYRIKNMKYTIMDIHTTSPLKLFEYMAAQRPIVATNIPTIRKVLKHKSSALLVSPDDTKAFCSAIQKLLKDRKLSSALSKKAFREVQKYTWEVRCKTIIKHFYQK